jgi:hypothetical protein
MFNRVRKFFGAQDPPPDQTGTESYFEKLIRYIPADIVAGYVALDGMLKEQTYNPLWLSWAVFAALLVLTPLYVCYIKTQPAGFVASKTFHWVASCWAFAVWVFALGGFVAVTFAWYRPIFGTVLLILTTMALPVLESCFYSPAASRLPPTKVPK